MRILIALFSAMVSFNHYGQSITDLSLDYAFTPLNFIRLKSETNDFDSLSAARNELENKGFAFNSSLKAGIKVNPKLFLETGIGMLILTSQSNAINRSSRHFMYGDDIIAGEYVFRYILLDVPLMARYELLKRNYTLFALSGFTFSNSIERSVVSDLTSVSGEELRTSEKIQFNAKENKLLFSGKLGLQMEFDVKKVLFRKNSNLVMYYQIIYRHMFSSLWTDSISERYHGVDFGCGVRYRLNKNGYK
ncbi:MAG: hypothetical protein OXH57_06395 [Ekhidna sp.]|nr:hypothetical protein [Ekhidna sp.]